MLECNSIPLMFSVVLFLCIITVSDTDTLIKILLAILTVAFLFPSFRDILFKNRARKLRVAIYTAGTYTIGYLLYCLPSIIKEHSFKIDIVLILFFIFSFSLVGNLLYGLPVSILAEIVSLKTKKVRFILSGFIHIGFGMLLYFFFLEMYVSVLSCSIIFFAIDEITRIKSN